MITVYDEDGEESSLATEVEADDVDDAVRMLKYDGVTEASSSHFHKGIWYMTEPQQDPHTGTYPYQSFHLKGFSEDEQREIYRRVLERRRRR